MSLPFIGRADELAVLEELAASGRPEFFVLYGRRRVGKTELLQRFCEPRRAVYFLAAQVREKDNLEAYAEALAEGTGDPLAQTVRFDDWPSALAFTSERAGDERLVLVLDEFPYLCEANKGLPSQIQKFWDTKGKRSNLMLVLCGSAVSFMEREVLAERSPLFGRRTAQRRLEPLAPADSLRFFEGWPLRDRVLAYSILGGMPAYLQRFDTRHDLATNLLREVLRPQGYLFDEVSFLLRSEFNQPATYNSILRAVARDAERVGDVAAEVGVDSTTANKYLHVLRELGLVQRTVPLTDPDPLRSRKGRYRIADRFVAFHFRHVQTNLSLIEAGRGERVLEESVAPDFARLFDDAVVDFALHHVRREAGTLFGSEAVEVGRHDGANVRALARLADERIVAIQIDGELESPRSELEGELEALRRFAGSAPLRLRYGIGDDVESPLRVERPRSG
ncbi:MAG: ATP-binding protein [Planctomycetota bacterium]